MPFDLPKGLIKRKASPNWIMKFTFNGKRFDKSTRTRKLDIAIQRLEAFKKHLQEDLIQKGNPEIYFLQADNGPIKIGFSIDIKNRLPAIQRWHPEEITLLKTAGGTTEGERSIHRLFKEDRIRGEWFKPSEKLLMFIRDLPKEYRSKKEQRRYLRMTLGPKSQTYGKTNHKGNDSDEAKSLPV